MLKDPFGQRLWRILIKNGNRALYDYRTVVIFIIREMYGAAGLSLVIGEHGFVNVMAQAFWALGSWLRGLQTGYIRSYVVFLVVAAVGIWVILSALLGPPVPK